MKMQFDNDSQILSSYPLLIPLLERKAFPPLPVRCCLQLSSQVHEHSLGLLFFVSQDLCVWLEGMDPAQDG